MLLKELISFSQEENWAASTSSDSQEAILDFKATAYLFNSSKENHTHSWRESLFSSSLLPYFLCAKEHSEYHNLSTVSDVLVHSAVCVDQRKKCNFRFCD